MNEKDFQRIYLAGYTARQNGKKEKDNPYADKPSLQIQRSQWQSGYNDAKPEAVRKFAR